MISEQFEALFVAYLAGNCSQEELAVLLDIIKVPENKAWVCDRIGQQLDFGMKGKDFVDENQLELLQKSLDDNLQQVLKRIDLAEQHKDSPILPGHQHSKKQYRLKWLVAAAATITLFVGVFWWNQQKNQQSTSIGQIAQSSLDFQPGKNAAVLTVDGGKQIYLDNNSTGSIASQGKTSITSDNGQIRYTANGLTDKTLYNTLTTSNGNQYTLVLPDGTKVWLNAASSIRYPVAFNGKNRVVEVTGELYFEVRHNDKQPFIVKAGDRTIEDIGTSFNVHAYPDEQTFSTTLLEGVIKVEGAVLKPGTQAIIRSGKLTIQTIDTSQVVAWKNGLFAFHQTSVKEVMRQIARWYDVEVEYQGAIPEVRFGGKISRNSNASAVLTILKKSGLVFKIEGRKIIVTGARQP